MDVFVELKPFGDLWQVTHNGAVMACAVERSQAINAAAGLLRRQLKDPTVVAGMRFVGVELTELLSARPMNPNWKRKGPPIETEYFEQAEAYLQTELIQSEEMDLLAKYRKALANDDFGTALDFLVQLGEQQECSNPFWKVVERLIPGVWPTQYMVDRRAKGQREARIATIKQRAKGRA